MLRSVRILSSNASALRILNTNGVKIERRMITASAKSVIVIDIRMIESLVISLGVVDLTMRTAKAPIVLAMRLVVEKLPALAFALAIASKRSSRLKSQAAMIALMI